MIPEAAVEAAADYLSLLMVDPDGDYTLEARDLLEAAAPHILAGAINDREEVEAQVKSIVQDVATTVDYTERLFAAVQKIMAVTMPKPTP